MSCWEELINCPFSTHWGSVHKGIIDEEFIFATKTTEGIFIYNCLQENWRKYEHCPGSLFQNHTAAFDDESKILYINDLNKRIYKVDFKTNTYKSFDTDNDGTINSSIAINNQFHIFNRREHKIWNNHCNKLELQTNAPSPLDAAVSIITYLPSKHCILIIGGMNISWSSHDLLRTYNIKTKQWKTLDLKLPKKLRLSGYVQTSDYRYVLIFGGVTDNGNIRDIFILDTTKMQFHKSKILTPSTAQFQVVIPQNRIQQKQIVFGYIRDIWKHDEFKDNIYLPVEIIQLLIRFYSMEYVHLIETVNTQNQAHWRIELQDLMDFE